MQYRALSLSHTQDLGHSFSHRNLSPVKHHNYLIKRIFETMTVLTLKGQVTTRNLSTWLNVKFDEYISMTKIKIGSLKYNSPLYEQPNPSDWFLTPSSLAQPVITTTKFNKTKTVVENKSSQIEPQILAQEKLLNRPLSFFIITSASLSSLEIMIDNNSQSFH